MGVDFSRPYLGGPPHIPRDISWTGVTWRDFIRTRISQPHIDIDNGFNFNGVVFPDHVVEDILCRLPDEDILKCTVVCRAWKDLLNAKCFWKKCFEQRGIPWDCIPTTVKDKPGGWIALYSQIMNNTFTKNYIKNPSGHLQFEDWTIYKNGGDRWLVEPEPIGCEHLPSDNFFGLNDTSCFVTSYQWCSKYVVIDLWQAGLNPTTMRLSLPLKLKCSQMFSPRFDCGGVFRWELRILDTQEKIIRDHKTVIERPPGAPWEKAEYSFKFKSSQAEFMKQVRYLVFIHDGRDSQFWKGHYGMKFARACVTLHCLETDPEEESEPEAEETAQSESGSEYDLI